MGHHKVADIGFIDDLDDIVPDSDQYPLAPVVDFVAVDAVLMKP